MPGLGQLLVGRRPRRAGVGIDADHQLAARLRLARISGRGRRARARLGVAFLLRGTALVVVVTAAGGGHQAESEHRGEEPHH
jgi:hypothetical protein